MKISNAGPAGISAANRNFGAHKRQLIGRFERMWG